MDTKQLIIAIGLLFASTANAAGLGNLLNNLTGRTASPPTSNPTSATVNPSAPKPMPAKPVTTSPAVQSNIAKTATTPPKLVSQPVTKPVIQPVTAPASQQSNLSQSSGNISSPTNNSISCGPTDTACTK